MGDYYTGQIHLVKSHYEFTILTILQGEFDQCSSHPFHLYQKIENGKNRYVEAQSARWIKVLSEQANLLVDINTVALITDIKIRKNLTF